MNKKMLPFLLSYLAIIFASANFLFQDDARADCCKKIIYCQNKATREGGGPGGSITIDYTYTGIPICSATISKSEAIERCKDLNSKYDDVNGYQESHSDTGNSGC